MILIDGLGLERQPLQQEMSPQMAVKGSISKINSRKSVDFVYSVTNFRKKFDIIYIANYDMILGIPFFGHHVARMKTLAAAAPHQSQLQGKGAPVNWQQSDTDLDGLPRSDTSESEMRVIRDRGDNRSLVPDETMKPHDSPRERSTSVAPATRQAGGKSIQLSTPRVRFEMLMTVLLRHYVLSAEVASSRTRPYVVPSGNRGQVSGHVVQTASRPLRSGDRQE
jgi:hypothetical protein